MKKDKSKAFTLAEILLSLSIIGIVAAIALPSLLGNVNERAFDTQKKALYTRFSQALPLLPSLNGYGTLEGTLSDEEHEQHVDVDTAAESFVRDGLSKVMKITNICDSEHLTDCGLPDKIIPINGGSAIELSNIRTLSEYNSKMMSAGKNNANYEQLNTKASAFETINGESVLVYYNPNCEPNYDKLYYYAWHFMQPKMCANFVYDLNGKKGPNTVGKDIGFITALYSTDSIIVAPNLQKNNLSLQQVTYPEAVQWCKESGENLRLPSIEEMASLFYNMTLLDVNINSTYWTSSSDSSDKAFVQAMSTGRRGYELKNATYFTYCIKR